MCGWAFPSELLKELEDQVPQADSSGEHPSSSQMIWVESSQSGLGSQLPAAGRYGFLAVSSTLMSLKPCCTKRKGAGGHFSVRDAPSWRSSHGK